MFAGHLFFLKLSIKTVPAGARVQPMCQQPHAKVRARELRIGRLGACLRALHIADNPAKTGGMTAILQTSLGYDPTKHRPLPGIAPMEPADWIIVDNAHAAQMAERARQLENRRDRVLAMDESARPAADELLQAVLDVLANRPDHRVTQESVLRPDGVSVRVERHDPMATLGHLVQQDLCLMEKRDDEHVLTAAVLCFPASWTLDEKFMRPLTGIHVPVHEYDDTMARRVQRLFDGVQVGRPIWRFNALWYADPALHQPRRENDRRPERSATEARYLRTERQSILRLPQTGAVVFGIHTSVLEQATVRALWPDA
jgi:dimethylamine monooxygenase subunit A